MTQRGSDLAARFRGAMEAADAETRRLEEEKRRRFAEAAAARDELLRDMASFGEAIGLGVQRDDAGAVTIRNGDRFLHLEPQGEGDRVKVTFTGMTEDEEHRLYREPALQTRWVWSLRRRGREDRLPLFDAGLEELIVLGLRLPRPGPPKSPSLDDLVPAPAPPTDDDKKRSL